MRNFYVEAIKATGKGRTPSEVTFIDGINIIKGDSDTGKTKILKSILFAMGGSHKPFAKKTGYDCVELTIVTPNGKITFTRKYTKNLIDVVSENDDIDGGTYSTEYDKDAPPINSVWLKLMGIEGQPMLASNKRFTKKRLTWNNLMRMFYIDEKEICRESSIIEPTQYTEKTLLLSSILFLMTGQDFSGNEEQEEKKIKTARKKAVEEYVNGKLDAVSLQRDELNAQLAAFDGIDVEKEVQSIIESLQETDAAITQAVNDSKELLGRIMQTEEKLSECGILISRYHTLQSQYKSDVRRLTFVVDGEKGMERIPQSTTCPFCDGKMPIHNRKSYMDTARAELARIVKQIEGLTRTEADVKEDQIVIQGELKELKAQRADIELLISQELKPKSAALTQSLQNYRAYLQIKNQIDIIKEFASTWTSDLRNLSEEDTTELEYRPKDYYDDEFRRLMDKYADSILTNTNYPHLTTARFNVRTFDIEVNGGTKVDDHGKGYCAFLNSVVALMFRKYLADNGHFYPGITMIDSPLHGMYQGVEDDAPESMKTGLFSYFCTIASEGQLIIAENDEHVPELDYKGMGVHEIVFSKTNPDIRHGFLLDVYQ